MTSNRTYPGQTRPGQPHSGQTRSRGEIRRRLRHLPSGLLASAVLFVGGVGVGAALQGGVGAAGAVLGVGLVATSFTVSSVVLAWADSINPTLVLPVGLMTYVLKFTVIGIACYALASTGWDGLPAFGVAVIVATLGWATAQAWWTWFAKTPYVDVEFPIGGPHRTGD